MNSFLDSNVLIGYIFKLDNLFETSEEFIFKSSKNYFSENVKMEVKRVFVRKTKEFGKFFSEIYRELSGFDDWIILSRSQLHSFINNFEDIDKFSVNDMHSSFELLWEEFEFCENQEVFLIKSNLVNYMNNFNGFNYSRKNKIFKELISVPTHKNKDKKILDMINKENLRDNLLHEEDENILFDAHEFCQKNKNLNLKFVSADHDFTEAINILNEYLCFDECINLFELTLN